MAMATATLPEDLFIEIMVWLPVKSLKRFTCLSKSLCTFIDSPGFIKLHLFKSPLNSNRKLILQSWNNFHVFDVNLNLEDEDILRLGKPVLSLLNMEIRGYCNGLLLFSKSPIYERSLPPSNDVPNYYPFKLRKNSSLLNSLWNPSTGQCSDLPSYPEELYSSFSFERELIGCGLVYDDSTNEYKVIFVDRSAKVTSTTYFELEFEVWIYELKSSKWRMIIPSFPRVEIYKRNNNFTEEGFNGIGHFTDGILYLSYGIYGWGTEIVEFDVRTETLSLVPQPAVCSISTSTTKLHLLEGCLCISYFSRADRPLDQAVDLYIRNKEGVLADVFNWTKLFSVTGSLFSDIIWPDGTVNVMGYSKRRDKILFGLGIHMFSYNLKEKSFDKVELDVIKCLSHTPILCVPESLVSTFGVGAYFF